MEAKAAKAAGRGTAGRVARTATAARRTAIPRTERADLTVASAVPAPHGPADAAGFRGRAFLVAGLAVAAFCAAFGALHYGFYTHSLLQDTPLYERYGDAMVHGGQIPYRDFAVEYPPGALPVFAAPSLLARSGDFARYREVFEALMLAFGGVASACVGVVLSLQRASMRRIAAGTLLAGLAPLALGPVVLSRFDLWPAMLTVGALAALVGERRRSAAVLLGCAIAAKLYPGVLLPLVVAYVFRRHGARAAAAFTGLAAGAVAVWLVPFLAIAPGGVWASVSGQAARPLQIESLGAAFLLAAHQAFGVPLAVVVSHGSDNLSGAGATALAGVQGVLMPAAVVAIVIGFVRGEATPDRLLRFSAGAVCAFIALGKVLSPQYLIWMIGLVPLVRGRRGAIAAALFTAAMVLTQLWFPQHYLELAFALDARVSWLVLARDLTLLALLAMLLASARHVRRATAAAGALVLAASAATAAAAVRAGDAAAPVHSIVLDETGVASTCSHAKRAPGTSYAPAGFAVTALENSYARTRCVTVTVDALRHVQLFAAAYLHRFDPGSPARDYLGDAGRCTNTPGGFGDRLRFSFRVPARSRFLVDVEQCGGGTGTPRYRLTEASR